MSLGKKCDVCGKFYENYTINNENRKVNAFILVCTDKHDRWFNTDDPIDCCPRCMRSILRHIESLRPTVDSSNDLEIEEE